MGLAFKLFLGTLVFSFVGNAAHAKSCEETLSPSSQAKSEFIDAYIKNVEANPADKNAQGENQNPTFDLDPLNARKLAFIRLHEGLLRRMIQRGDLTMSELRQRTLFFAEHYSQRKYKDFGYVLVLKSGAFGFSLSEPNRGEELVKARPLFTNTPLYTLRLDKQYILKLGASSPDYVVYKGPYADPALISQIKKEPELDAVRLEILNKFRPELEQMLAQTDFSFYEFMSGFVAKVKVKGSKADVYMILSEEGTHAYYLSKKAGVIDPQNQKLFGILGPQPKFKTSVDFEREIVFENGYVAKVVNNQIVSNAHTNPQAIGQVIADTYQSLMQVADQNPAAKIGAEFYQTFAYAIAELMAQQMISMNLAEMSTLTQAVHPLTETKYYVIETAKGFVAFHKDLPKKWEFVRNIDTDRPTRWATGRENLFIVIRESIGFQKSLIEEYQLDGRD